MHASTSPAITTLLAHPPVDWVVLAFVWIMILIDALRSGTARAATLSIVMPLTLFILNSVQHAAVIGPVIQTITAPLMQAGIFAALFGTLFFLLYRIMYPAASAGDTPLVAVIGSASATIIALVVWLMVPALQSVWHFGPMIQTAFGGLYAFWWLIAGLLLMAFVRS